MARSAGLDARRVGAEHARGQAVEEDRLVVGQPQVLQRDVHVRERHRERARRRARRRDTCAPAPARRRDRSRRRWRTSRARTRPGASRTRSRSAAIGSSTAPVVPDSARPSSASRVGGRAPAAEETRAIGLPFDCAAEPALDAEHVERPDGARSALRGRRLKSKAGTLRIEVASR